MSSVASRAVRAARFVAVGLAAPAAALSLALAPHSAFAAGQVLGTCHGTSDKPQSKIWYNDGSYWAVLETTDGSHIMRLDAGNWTEGIAIDPHMDSGDAGHEDVLWDGTHLYVLVYQSSPSVYKYTYSSALQTYQLVAGFPVSFDIPSGSETMVIDQDSSGRLWAAYEAGGNIYAAYTTSADQRTWATPGVVLRSGVNDDDVASVVHFGGNRVGVFWSDQNRWEFGFRVHVASDAPDSWSAAESVRPGTGNSDDHLNLAADSAGRVYAITKDVKNEFAVSRRDTNGHWTTKENITASQNGTRPVLMLDASETKLYALYTCWSCGGSDPILYRIGSTSTLAFGSATTFLTAGAQSLNNVTDMKQVLPSGSLVAIAHGGGQAYWNGWGSPPPGNGFGGTSGGGGSNPPPPPPPPPPAPAPPGPPTTVAAAAALRHVLPGVVATFLFDEPTGDTTANGIDTAQKGTLGAPGPDTGEPQHVTGVQGGALHFDGTNDYVEVPAAYAPGQAGSFTIEAWVRRTTPGSPDVLIAKEGSIGRNFRLRITASDQVEFAWKSLSGSSRTTTGAAHLTDAAWHHVAAVRDGDLREDRIYVDGILDVRRSDTATPGATADPLLLGARRSSGIKEPLGGDLDMVRICSQAMYTDNFTPPAAWDEGPAQPYVALSWGAPTSGGTPTGYVVYRSANADDEAPATPAAVTETDWPDTQPIDGVLVYRVAAVNAQGESAKSTAITLTFGAGPTRPGAPARPQVRLVNRVLPLDGNAIYRLDEAAGPTSDDGSGGAHVLVLGGAAAGDAAEPAWIAGRAGAGLHFDGSDDYAMAADDPLLRFGSSFTLEAWVRPTTGKYGTLIAKESTSAGRNYRLAVTATGKLELQWKNTAGATYTLASGAAMSAGAWHHVAGVFDAALGESRLFVDGQAAGRAATPGAPQTGDAALRLGARQSSSLKDFFAGDLDLVRLTPLALYRDAFTPPDAYAEKPVTEHRIDWTASEPGSARLVGYHIERSVEDGAWQRLTTAPLAATTCVLEETAPVRVAYRIVALDRLGLESAASEPRSLYVKSQSSAHPIDQSKTAPVAAALGVAAGPNPFNPSTTIVLRLPEAVHVEAHIYDAGGRVVRTLVAAALPAGEHRFVWDGRDAHHEPLASGIYFLRLQAGSETRHLKLVLAK